MIEQHPSDDSHQEYMNIVRTFILLGLFATRYTYLILEVHGIVLGELTATASQVMFTHCFSFNEGNLLYYSVISPLQEYRASAGLHWEAKIIRT